MYDWKSRFKLTLKIRLVIIGLILAVDRKQGEPHDTKVFEKEGKIIDIGKQTSSFSYRR